MVRSTRNPKKILFQYAIVVVVERRGECVRDRDRY